MRFHAVFPGFLLLLLLVAAGPAQALDVSSLRDPRPWHWTLDHSGQLGQATLADLDALGREVGNRSGHELVVVCVDSTGGEGQRAFATRLFNRWQLGDRQHKDGVLLFVALGDHRVEFILGDGVDDDARVAASQAIVDQDMLPRFKAGDRDGAVLAGARAGARRLLGLEAATAGPAAPGATRLLRGDGDAPPAVTDVPANSEPVERPAGAQAPVTPPLRHAPASGPAGFTDDGTWLMWGAAGAGAGALLGFWWWRRWLRDRPRICDRCQQPMVRLDESQDDQHLNHGEQVEERLGSVDYDVWCCSACPHVLKLRYGTFFTSYARCPRCRAVTRSNQETTLITATYDHDGRVQVDEACAACDYRYRFVRSTPHKTRPSTGRRGGGSFIDSGGSGNGGGNSGGGGGGGGGHSSGRGGGGGW